MSLDGIRRDQLLANQPRRVANRDWRRGVLCAGVLAMLIALIPFPAYAADLAKVLRVAFKIAETDFDPGVRDDFYSIRINENIFDSLLRYDYLARPAKLKPNTAEMMPEISADGLTYSIHVRKGIYFTADPAFKGRSRELTAADYAYSIKRLLDPQVRSKRQYLVEGKFVGADVLVEQAKKTGHFDYDAPVAGIEAVDRYTLRFILTHPDFNLLYILADPSTAAMAREVVEAYGSSIGAHPIGSGPYVLKEWVRSSKIVLEANPGFREMIFNAEPGDDPRDREIAAALQGKRLPLIGRIEVFIIEEEQPRWLAFLNKEHDYLLDEIPFDFVNQVVADGRLLPIYSRQGIRAYRFPDPEITYFMFNMEDPLVGGYSAEKVALRRAMSLGYNVTEQIQIIHNGQAIVAQAPIGPGVAGYDPDFHTTATDYNPAKAKALLDMYGYLDRDGDGCRDLPDGGALAVTFSSQPTQLDNQFDLLWSKSMRAIGICLRFNKQRWPDLTEATRLGSVQMREVKWQADYPDADNFLQLLYGPNTGASNDARFRLPQYDRLYEKARRLPDSLERDQLYREMTRLVLVYAPWKLGVHRIFTHLTQPWLIGYKKHPFVLTQFRYLDIDLELRRKALQ